MYTIEELEKAKAELARLEKAWENYSGNNPDKYRSKIRDARSTVNFIEYGLKVKGVLPYSEKELLDKKLDQAFPNAQSKQIVEFEGKRYQRTFTKVSHEWQKDWIEIPSLSQFGGQ